MRGAGGAVGVERMPLKLLLLLGGGVRVRRGRLLRLLAWLLLRMVLHPTVDLLLLHLRRGVLRRRWPAMLLLHLASHCPVRRYGGPSSSVRGSRGVAHRLLLADGTAVRGSSDERPHLLRLRRWSCLRLHLLIPGRGRLLLLLERARRSANGDAVAASGCAVGMRWGREASLLLLLKMLRVLLLALKRLLLLRMVVARRRMAANRPRDEARAVIHVRDRLWLLGLGLLLLLIRRVWLLLLRRIGGRRLLGEGVLAVEGSRGRDERHKEEDGGIGTAGLAADRRENERLASLEGEARRERGRAVPKA